MIMSPGSQYVDMHPFLGTVACVEEALPSILKVKIKFLKKEGLYQTKIDYSIKWPTCDFSWAPEHI